MPLDAAALNALRTQWAIDKANLDDQQNKLGINYNTIKDKLKRQLKDSSGQLAVNMADTGMRHSGASVQQNVKLGSDYARSSGDAATQMNSTMATIARKKLEADASYRAQKALLMAGLQGS
jgi:hypothetical protein